VFDALRSARPYKDAMAYAVARQEIEMGRGTHFDPDVVDAFLRFTADEWDTIGNEIENTDSASER